MNTDKGIQDDLQISNNARQLFKALHERGSVYSHGCDTRNMTFEEERYEKLDEKLLHEIKLNILRKHIIEQLQDNSNSLLYKEELLEKYDFLFDFKRKASNTETTYKVDAPCMKNSGLLDDWESYI
tara:strand:+ start:482 stop:859 length:378 start_codon:yes stop_codon:yes gene_type:complete